MKNTTKAIHTPYPSPDAYGALAMPVYNCCAYEFKDHQEMADSFCARTTAPDYSRVTNPTVIHFENIVKNLTGANDVIAFNSGMAAISAIFMAITGAGKKVVTSRHLFGNTYLLLTSTLKRFGVETVLVDLTDPEAVRKAVDDNTACIYLETITNPQMEVADIAALADIAHSHNAALVADTTMIPFTFADVHALGVDIEVLSSTKYLSGGATSLGGLIIDYGTVPGFKEAIRRDILMNFGGYMTPNPAYLQTLGLETLQVRYEAQQANALEVALALAETEGVEVCYPGLPGNPYHELCNRQFDGNYSAMMTITLPSEEACYRFIDSLNLVKRATNLFDNRTLAIHPYSTIYGTIPVETRLEMDVSPRLIRLSIGLEDAEDIIADLRQAIEKAL